MFNVKLKPIIIHGNGRFKYVYEQRQMKFASDYTRFVTAEYSYMHNEELCLLLLFCVPRLFQ